MTTSNTMTQDLPLDLLYKFTSAASSTLDARTLFTHFFNLLATEVDFDIGAFLVSHKHTTEARAYAKGGTDSAVIDRFTKYFARKVVGQTAGLEALRMPALEVCTLPSKRRGSGKQEAEGTPRTLKVPLRCWGNTTGVIALVSFSPGKGFDEARVVRAMAEHAGRVLERLFTHHIDEEKKLNNILFSMTEGVYILDREGSFTAINPLGFDLVTRFCHRKSECIKDGRCPDEESTCGFKDFIDKLPSLSDELARGQYNTEIKNAEGMILSVSAAHLTPGDRWASGFLITTRDVTDERIMQERIFLSSKLASLGEMAAGIAHEINNPLQAILLNIEMLGIDISEKGKKRLDCVEDGVTRIKNIVKDLLVFAREETTDTENVDINTVIEKSADILRHQMKVASVEVQLDLEKRPLIVDCNRNLFQQVMINLLQNSKDAIEGASKGSTVTIRTRLLSPTQLSVEVADDGPGVPEEIQTRIFDPFLTTKDVGKGTGLGLSVSRKIIEGMGGFITLKSVPGEHTSFTIELPHCGELLDERRTKRRREPDYGLIKDKRVLMIDDEPEVLKTVTEALGMYVASIEPVSESRDAIAMVEERDYDLIFLDIKMPGIDGKELFRKVVEKKPLLSDRVIFLSGDTESENTSDFISTTGCRYLSKPFGIKELLSAMCETVAKAELCTKG